MKDLTDSQRILATSASPIVVAIAGPGSGKTHTLIARYRHRGTAAATIITFTNAGARELRERLTAGGGQVPKFVGTLHAFCLLTLKAARPGLTLLTEGESEEMILETLAETRGKMSAKAIRKALSASDATQPEKVVCMRYRAKLKRMNAEDYDTLLLAMLEYLESASVEVGDLYVDEYQDSGAIDHRIYRALSFASFFAVGDVDQSIYGFRGGRPENLMELASTPGVFTGYLPENFRSGSRICKAASNLIANNSRRLSKGMKPMRKTDGLVEARSYENEDDEQAAVIDLCREFSGLADSTTAVLCRYNADRSRYAAALAAAGVAVAESLEPDLPKDWPLAMTLLSVVASPGNQMAAYRFLKLTQGVEQADLQRTRAHLEMREMRPFEAPESILDAWEALRLSKAARTIMLAAVDALGVHSNAWKPRAAEILLYLMNATAPAKAVSAGVEVLTMHGAKGREFDAVVIPGAEEGAVKEIEEQRRLFFVAVTRARDCLVVTSAEKRRSAYGSKKVEDKTISRFVLEMAGPDNLQ